MSVLSTIASYILPPTEAQELRVSDYPSFDEQLAAIQRRHSRPKPWSAASVSEALGVPAIFGAVSLISNTVGSLSLEAYRQGVLLAEPPRLIVRPNPFTTPRAFFRDTAFYLATRGEAWWWIAARDVDGAPMSLYPIPPWEITVAQNDFNRLRPTISWGNRQLRNEDVRQITYLPSHDGLRGVGPLQLCGAAVSVSVESQEWAANFYSGSLPSIIGTTEQDMSEDELKLMDKQWNEKAPNMPRWLTNGLTLSESPVDPEKAQLTESRQHQVGEAARAFSMPGALIEYQMGGSSLTYQNQADIWNDFQRRCLSPHYLEPIEQEISDLLTRSTAARFNLKQLLRADPKTRYEVHTAAIGAGIYDSATAAREEGYAPGAVDFAPVPLAPPQAVPSLLPINRAASEIRCEKCHRLLAESATPPYRIACPRCKTVAADDRAVEVTRSEPAPQPITVEVHPPAITVEAPQITFERGAFQMDAVDLRPVAEAAERPPSVTNINVTVPEVGEMSEQVRALVEQNAQRAEPDPPLVNVDTTAFAGALIDLQAEIRKPRKRTILRDKKDKIIGSLEESA